MFKNAWGQSAFWLYEKIQALIHSEGSPRGCIRYGSSCAHVIHGGSLDGSAVMEGDGKDSVTVIVVFVSVTISVVDLTSISVMVEGHAIPFLSALHSLP
jgi:hypothetical protein